MPDKTTGARTSADATIAAAQRMAFPIKYFLFMMWNMRTLSRRLSKMPPDSYSTIAGSLIHLTLVLQATLRKQFVNYEN
jgi:hypothetical protein